MYKFSIPWIAATLACVALAFPDSASGGWQGEDALQVAAQSSHSDQLVAHGGGGGRGRGRGPKGHPGRGHGKPGGAFMYQRAFTRWIQEYGFEQYGDEDAADAVKDYDEVVSGKKLIRANMSDDGWLLGLGNKMVFGAEDIDFMPKYSTMVKVYMLESSDEDSPNHYILHAEDHYFYAARLDKMVSDKQEEVRDERHDRWRNNGPPWNRGHGHGRGRHGRGGGHRQGDGDQDDHDQGW